MTKLSLVPEIAAHRGIFIELIEWILRDASKKSKKLLIYFLLILFGSINNINLINTNFYKIKEVKISGLEINENKNILKKFKILN